MRISRSRPKLPHMTGFAVCLLVVALSCMGSTCACAAPGSSGPLDAGAFAARVSPDNVLAYLAMDYDGDGTVEVFAITGTGSPFIDEKLILYDNVSIYFISSDSQVTLLRRDLFGFMTEMDIIQIGRSRFLTWEKNSLGSASVTYVFGVRNGKPYEPKISGKYGDFRRLTEDVFKATKHKFTRDRGHLFIGTLRWSPFPGQVG